MDEGWPHAWDVSDSAGLGLLIHGSRAEKGRKGEKERGAWAELLGKCTVGCLLGILGASS